MITRTQSKRATPRKAKLQASEIQYSLLSATVPSAILDEVKKATKKGDLSRFVARALKRELLRLHRLAFVKTMEAVHGPIDQTEVQEFVKLLRS